MSDEQLHAWTVEALSAEGRARLGGPLPARVPGSVHVDLIAAGLIDDLTVRGRDDDQLWVSETPWRYRTTVRRPAEPFERALLVFEGIDTLARVSVAGRPRLRTRDMFRRHELDVTDDLATGDDVEVVVEFDPVLPVVRAREEQAPLPRPADYWRPFSQIRKMACSFGWDWGPTTMSAGLWRPVRLRTWIGGRFRDVRVAARPGDGQAPARVDVEVAVEGDAGALQVLVEDGDRPVASTTTPVVGGRARVAVPVPQARPWWPHTEGDPALYDVTVVLLGTGRGVLERRRLRVGFRSVEAGQVPDAEGVGFALHVNGRRVWVRGLDWVPDDPFPSRVTPERYRARLAEAVAAGANAIRVWGGGTYEDDAFYDACDELGLLVIQDFLFACAAYPEDDETVAEVRAEAGDAVRRLRHRASLALWCGNNENLWGHADWGWQAVLGDRPWGLRYYAEILPQLVAELDGTRPYVPGSPFSPDSPDGTAHHPNDPGRGIQHIWDVWNERDYADYETWRPRFVAEFGYQAPASWPTLVTAVGAPLDPADPALAHHQRASDGAAKLAAGLARHLPRPPERGPDWYFAAQLMQARAVTTGVCHLRSLHEHCSGAVWWQLNDIWPAVSWSVLDVRGRRKLAWHALRRAFDARLVTIAAGPRVVLVNDTGEPWSQRLVVRLADAAGARVVLEQDVEVPAHGALDVDVDAPADGALVAVADVGDRRATRWLVPDPELALPPQRADVSARLRDADASGGRRVDVRVSAHDLLRDVCLLPELVLPDARVEGQLVTLLPGEAAEFTVEVPSPGAVAGVDWPGLLWSDNRLRAAQACSAPANI